MTTQTHISVNDDHIKLFRLLDRRYYTIEFSRNVTVADAAPYFNMCDDEFKKFGAILQKHDI